MHRNSQHGNQHLYRISKFDFILAVCILCFSFLSLIWVQNAGSSVHRKAKIYRNNELVREVDLSHDGELKIDEVELQVKDGRIRMERSDCPQKICMHTRWISHPAQTIVCIPNKILVEIAGTSSEYNAVSY